MYFSEKHAQGFRKCSLLASYLRDFSFWFILAGVAFFVLFSFLAILTLFGIKSNPTFLFFVVPPPLLIGFGVGMNLLGKYIASAKGFSYDYESDRCTWEGGKFPLEEDSSQKQIPSIPEDTPI